VFRLLAAAAAAVMLGAAAPEFDEIYAFKGAPDGAYPGGPLAIDRAGNLYGVTEQGGSSDNGAIYQVSPPRAGQTQWTERVVASIPSDSGYGHTGGVAFSGPHALNATSVAGGAEGCGSILGVNLSGAPAVRTVHAFTGGDGCHPTSPPVPGRDGTLYGVTGAGGAHGFGALYALPPSAEDTKPLVIWSFAGPDGSQPGGPPLIAGDGTLYGTAYGGGARGFGTIWSFSPPRLGAAVAESRQVLWSFLGAPDCAAPAPGLLLRDAHGNLFGACQAGGGFGYGGIFELSPPARFPGPWTERVIADSDPETGVITGGLVFDHEGRLIATSRGITDNRSRVVAIVPPPPGQRSVMTTLWVFPASTTISPVVVGLRTPLFGTMSTGGTAGTVWSLKAD
jgi:uncharacterized repeat protein (TIGR03803 family)